jgi:copper chaperone CopZ
MDNTRTLRIPLYELDCASLSAATIERALAATPGVSRAYVNPVTELAYVDIDAASCDEAALITAIERAGYRAGQPRVG